MQHQDMIQKSVHGAAKYILLVAFHSDAYLEASMLVAVQ
jgi:hypothetical protein